jgi:hypothetical protein
MPESKEEWRIGLGMNKSCMIPLIESKRQSPSVIGAFRRWIEV